MESLEFKSRLTFFSINRYLTCYMSFSHHKLRLYTMFGCLVVLFRLKAPEGPDDILHLGFLGPYAVACTCSAHV